MSQSDAPPPTSTAPHGAVPSRSFGSVAAEYERGRPGYPVEAVEWLVGTEPQRVLELGAGTGKLTEALVGLGHDVFATDPDDAMLDILSAKLPDVRATVGTAEQVPAPDASFDVVVAGQAFHWFDLEVALPEIARVLRPGGRLALIWNERDERIPWVKRLGALIDKPSRGPEFSPAPELVASGLFSAVDEKTFRHWQLIDRQTIQDLVTSRSNVAVLSAEQREAKRREVLAFYDDYGRGMDGMQLPYSTLCFRTTVIARPHAATPVLGNAAPPSEHPNMDETAVRLPRIAVGDGGGDDGPTEMVLIDFR